MTWKEKMMQAMREGDARQISNLCAEQTMWSACCECPFSEDCEWLQTFTGGKVPADFFEED